MLYPSTLTPQPGSEGLRLLSALKNILRGRLFGTNEEVIIAAKPVLSYAVHEDFLRGFYKTLVKVMANKSVSLVDMWKNKVNLFLYVPRIVP